MIKALSECEQQTVVVYSTLCEVTRLVEHDFDKPGQYDVCIEGLPNVMLEQTLRVTGGVGHATVLEVTTHRRHDEEADKKALPEDIQQKKAEVERLEAEQRDLKVQLDALQASAAWLEAWANDVADTPLTHAKAEHKADGGAAFLSPEYIGNVQRFTEFYAEEQTRLVTQRKDLQKRIDEAAARLKTANDEYHKAMMANNSGPHVITSATVTLDVSQAGRAAFNIVYRVPGCSWHSRYDCRLGADNKVQLTYYGVVVNSTGEAWLNTHLALSTADPSLCAEPPLLSTAPPFHSNSLLSFSPPPSCSAGVGVPSSAFTTSGQCVRFCSTELRKHVLPRFFSPRTFAAAFCVLALSASTAAAALLASLFFFFFLRPLCAPAVLSAAVVMLCAAASLCPAALCCVVSSLCPAAGTLGPVHVSAALLMAFTHAASAGHMPAQAVT